MSQDYLGMTDEEFGKLNSPTGENVSAKTPGETPDNPAVNAVEPKGLENDEEVTIPSADQLQPAVEDKPVDPPADAANPLAAADAVIGDKPGHQAVAEPKKEAPGQEDAALPGSSSEGGKAAPADGAAPAVAEAPAEPAKEVDYAGFYNRLIGKPIRANGKDLILKTPEEVERLVQMGAGAARKIQDLQPHLKTLRMLEKANLLDPNELSYLIDIRNKNPDALKKLIKESGIDPLDLNPNDNVDYTPQNHSVTDDEMRFHDALTEVQTQPTGQETLRVINQTWDQTSKNVLWESPELLSVIQTQRDNGVYDQIVAEIDRQKLFGAIPSSTPFLQAYKIAGDTLVASNGLKEPQSQVTTTTSAAPIQTQPQVIATRPGAPKPQVLNSDKARAASPTQTTGRKAAPLVNPLEMADDEFMKQFEGRL